MEREPYQRSRRDWVVDSTMFLCALGWMALIWDDGRPAQDWWFALDVITGFVACVTIWFRRRWPVGIAVVLLVFSAYSNLSSGAVMIVLFSLAVHRPMRVSLPVAAGGLVAGAVYAVLRPEPGLGFYGTLAIGTVITAAAIGWGLYIRSRRELLSSLRERADRAEEEAGLRAEQAHQRARTEIAREMHDVLGHRLSLLSVHAGALEYRTDATREDVATAAGVIRANAHQALQDLREVIGVLRAPVGELSEPGGELPQPRYADLPGLIEESSRAGMRVTFCPEVDDPVPDRLGRNTYRIVQEALTNARKHAPGAAVTVSVTGGPGPGLTVEVRNGPGPRARPGPPGQGLIGLAERAALFGGKLQHGPVGFGYRVLAWLPWPADDVA